MFGFVIRAILAVVIARLLPIVTGDIQWRLSGGAGNADPNASLGGIMSATAIVDATNDNLFDDVSGAESSAGDIEYRGFYVRNNHGSLTLQGSVIYISSLTSSADTEFDLAVAAEAMNVDMATIANESTAPATVSFTRPTTFAGGLQLNGATGLTSGSRRGCWIRRTINAAAAAAADAGTLKVEGDTAP
jgi:hypothetical protein